MVNTQKPTVSIIIPNYNHSNYLKKRIQSIINQTYQDFEIIFLDDASTDNSLEIFSQFSDNSCIRSIFNQTNSGSPFKQWNKGIRECKGKYIWIAESDDYADPLFLEVLVPILNKNSSVGLAYCRSWRIDEKDNIICSCRDTIRYSDPSRWKADFIAPGVNECMQHMVFENIIPNTSAVLIKRSVFESIGYADEDFRLAGDWMNWMRILLSTNVAYVNQPLNYFRCHSQNVRSTTLSDGLHLEEKYKALARIFKLNNGNYEVRESVGQIYFNEWMNASFSHSVKIPWIRQVAIYNHARSFDSNINKNLIKTITLKISAKFKDKFKEILSNLYRFAKKFVARIKL